VICTAALAGVEFSHAIGRAGDGLVAGRIREDEYGTVVFGERELRVIDSKGMRCLAALRGRPGVEVSSLELVGGESTERLSGR
jgi:hypothetical protein